MYDGDGNRVKKTPQSGTATEYFYADGTLYKEKFGVDTILYYRDEDGEICSFMLNYSPYILRKNAQGDVIALCDSNGAVVARYVYDAWGNHKVLNPDGTENTSAGFIGNVNPIRYRGYYYDKDLGLYWLKTRFYDPQTGIFISPDSVEYLDPETLGGINLYAYCNNNPVMNVDPSGHIVISLLVGLAVSFVVGTTASAISQYVQYGEVNLIQAGIDGLFAVASTALAYTGIGMIGSIALGAGLGLAQYAFHDDFTWSGALIATGLGALGGFIGGRGAQHYKSIGSNLDETGRRGVKAILSAYDRYGTGAGYQKVMNLWGGRVADSIAKSVSQNFTKGAMISWGTTAGNYALSYFLGKIKWGF